VRSVADGDKQTHTWLAYMPTPRTRNDCETKLNDMKVLKIMAGLLLRHWPLIVLVAIALLALYGLIWKLKHSGALS
jgi:hypothetical protein